MDMIWLAVSIVISAVGFVLFAYGKKQTRVPQMICGITLMVYPYFVANTWLMAGIGAALLGLLWVAVRLDY